MVERRNMKIIAACVIYMVAAVFIVRLMNITPQCKYTDTIHEYTGGGKLCSDESQYNYKITNTLLDEGDYFNLFKIVAYLEREEEKDLPKLLLDSDGKDYIVDTFVYEYISDEDFIKFHETNPYFFSIIPEGAVEKGKYNVYLYIEETKELLDTEVTVVL